jgi:hypothetical protein
LKAAVLQGQVAAAEEEEVAAGVAALVRVA